MKILVLGAYHSPNLGDPVICDCVADILRRRYPEAEVCCHDLVNRKPPQPVQERMHYKANSIVPHDKRWVVE